MPDIFAFHEQLAKKKGLAYCIDAILDIRFGGAGRRLMPAVNEAQELNTLRQIIEFLKQSNDFAAAQKRISELIDAEQGVYVSIGYEMAMERSRQILHEAIKIVLEIKFGDAGKRLIQGLSDARSPESFRKLLELLKQSEDAVEVERRFHEIL